MPKRGDNPLPPPDSPLASIYEELKSRAADGDAEAAARMYHEILGCANAQELLRRLQRSLSRLLYDDTSKLSAEELVEREDDLAEIAGELDKARRHSDLCAGVSDDQLLLAPAALRAAQLGDSAASNCYVGGVMLDGKGLLDHPEWLAEYKNNAPTLAQAAVTKGDWSMVAQLQRAYAQSLGAGLLGQVTGADPVQSYRYLKLRQLGTIGQRNASIVERQLARAAQGLSAANLSSSDAWAQDSYQRYFSANPAYDLGRGANTCHDD